MSDEENVEGAVGGNISHISAPMPHISPPRPLNLQKHAVENWKLWKQLWTNYSVITKLDQQTEEYRIALFLHAAGEEALRIYNGLDFAEDENDLKTIIAKFDIHIIVQTNETYERYVFNKRDQGPEETIEAYVTALRILAKTCNFSTLHDSLIRDRIVLGIRDHMTRKRLLQERKLSLQVSIDICKSRETTSNQLKSMTNDSTDHEGINKLRLNSNFNKGKSKFKNNSRYNSQQSEAKTCKFCDRNHPFRKELCPAYGKTCNICAKKNHFSVKCPNKKQKPKVHQMETLNVNTESDSENELILSISTVPASVNSMEDLSLQTHICAVMLLNNDPVKFQIDCGASVNVLPSKYLSSTNNVVPCETKLQMWNQSEVNPLGKCRITLRNPENRKKYNVEFYIVTENLTPLLGKRASEQMGLITINYNNFTSIAAVNSTSPPVISTETPDDLMNEYADVFNDELGTFPGEVHLQVDDTVTPQTSAVNHIPIALKSRAKEELDKLVDRKVIAPVDEPTDWNSSIVIATKQSGDLRICLCPKPLNRALKRERYHLETLDELLPKLSKAKVFSKLDLSSGYWHVVLDQESSLLTTFQTPWGRYRWLRLPFGTNVSAEIFQKHLNMALDGLESAYPIADDILVYGSGNSLEEANADHMKNLRSLLQRCRERGIKLSRKKAEIGLSETCFHGHLITRDGLKPDPKKVEAIAKLSAPTNVEEVQRLNGTVNYLARFMPHLSHVMEPIRQLTRHDVSWNWSSVQDQAFDKVKTLITSAPVLNYYDPQAELVIQCDASEKGLGAALLQHGKPVAYASRALTDAETRYAQIEKEMLAVCYSLEKFHQYTFGRHTRIDSDHKPLESIIKKPLSKAPKRLQGMLLRAQQYDIEIVYKRGKDMHIADMLSRSYLPNTESNQTEFEKVNMVDFLPIRDERLQQIRQAVDNDEVTCQLRQIIQHGWPDNKEQLPAQLVPYFSSRDEMSVQDGLIFKGQRIVIPLSMRQELKKSIHSSHIGIDGCLRRARECLYWPGMSSEIKEYISTCETCRKFEVDQPKETLMSHDIPDRPWQKIGTDPFHFDGKDYIVTVDYFSNFWEIDRLEDTTATGIIRVLKSHFARYGIPCQVVTDPGPQFNSEQFQRFSEKWDFEHLMASPGNHKANGKAESAVKSAKRLMKKAKEARADPFLALLDFRNTPTQGVGSSPAQRLMNRRTRTLLPMTKTLLQSRTGMNNHYEHTLLKSQQDKQAKYYNKTAHDLPVLNEGDIVRMRPYIKGSKEWKKGVVTKRLDDRSYEVETPDYTFRRNRHHLRKSNECPPVPRQNSANPASAIAQPIPVDKPAGETPVKSPKPTSSQSVDTPMTQNNTKDSDTIFEAPSITSQLGHF